MSRWKTLPRQCQNKLSPLELDQLVVDYHNGIETNLLLSKYQISTVSLYKYLKIKDVKPNRNKNRHLNLFSSIDNEQSAYWLGFIAADGCIQVKRNQLHIALSQADYSHLCGFRKALSVKNRIKWSRPQTRGKRYGVSTLDIFSEGMINDLTLLGISERKTYSLKWPPVPDALERHFIRGYFDGDGSWSFVRSQWRSNLSFECIGTESLLRSIQDRLVLNCQLQYTKLKTHHLTNVIRTLVYGGNLQCIRIANYLYEDATIYLPRKRTIVLTHYSQFPEYYSQLRFS